jgi:hypothetical protein
VITNLQIREIKVARTPRRYLVKMTCGDNYVILHPNDVACGSTEMVIHDPDGIHFLKMAEAELVDIGPAAN